MFNIQLVFQAPHTEKKIFLDWKLCDNPAAMMWFKILLSSAQKKTSFFPRFTGFVSRHKTMKDIQRNLNRCIDIINAESIYKISEYALDCFDQEFANVVHHHFEILAGSIEKPSRYMQNASVSLRHAISGLNYFIHDMESLHRSLHGRENGFLSSCGVVTQFMEPIKRYRIPEEFLTYFTLDPEFGDMVLHYSQIGKTWWEVFLDRDHEIGQSAILPLYVLSGEFDIIFVAEKTHSDTKKEFFEFLKNKNLNIEDPKLALGYLPVASLVREKTMSNIDYLELIGEHLSLLEVRLFEGENLLGVLKAETNSFNLHEKIGVVDESRNLKN